MNSTSAVIVRSLLLGTSCLSVVSISPAIAQPHGGTVAAGSATISGGANLTTIDQTTNKAVINWQSFSVAAGGTVQFNQPGAKSVTLNRVTGPDASAIDGAIKANGQVWIINGNGILFGKGAQINVGGLIATTSDIADGDFMSGTNSFSGGTGASVVNQGTIRARNGGSVVLSGAHVSNEGLVQADAGTVVLGGASAFTVDFDGDNLLRYAITAPADHASVSNSGTIQANSGGHVILTARAAEAVADNVVNNSGMISATSAKTENGEVILDGGEGGTVNVSGAVTATGNGADQTGGTVAITGSTVRVADNTTIDASGNAGGGTVNIGGNAHGQGPLQNADNTSVGSATIRADATRTGNGGTVVVWSNGLTDFSGIISAIGGTVSGNGGFVETSGHNLSVAPTATVDTHAPKGNTGTWLLDPDDLIIQTGGSSTLNGGNILLTDNPGGTSVVDPATITAALATTDVTLEAAQQLNVEDPVVYTSSHALNLLSEGTVGIDNSIQNAGTGAITIVSGWNGTTAPGAIITTPGSYGRLDVNSSPYALTLNSGEGGPDVEVGSKGGLTTIAGGNIDLTNFGSGSVQIGYHGAGATGAIIVQGTGSVSLDGNVGDVQIGNGSLSSDVTGPISGNIDVRSASTIDINQSSGSAWIGNSTATANAETGNVILIAGDNNSSSNVDITTLISTDLQGGDFLLGSTDPTPTEVAALSYSSPHTLSILAAGDLDVTGDVLNTGSGAINLVAGWDGVTVVPANFGNPGAFGLNNAILTVGGSSSAAAVGSASGATSAYAADLIVEADSASAQFGYRGAGTGALTIAVTDTVSVLAAASNAYAVIGNGDTGTSANGAITIVAPSGVSVAATGTSDAAKIGNGLNNSSGTVSGHILISAGSGSVGVVNTGNSGYAQIGNGGDGNTGDISGVVTVNAGSVIVSTSGSNEFAFIGNGNAHSSGTVTGDVNVTASTVALAAGGDTQTVKIGNGTDFSSYSVSGNVTVTASLVTMGATAGAAAVQIGNGAHDDTGSATGTITVNTGSLVMSTAAANEYVLLGTGGVGDTGALSGNINVFASGNVSLSSFDPTAPSVYIAHLGSATGNVTVAANQITGIDPSFGAVSDGDFVLEVTGAGGFTASSQDNIFSGAHNLYILSAGPVSIPGKIENTGSGGITIDAGWSTDATDLTQLQTPGAFGNNSAGLTIGGSSSGVAVGSVGGPLVLLASTLTLDGSAGYAQAGYHGAGGGAITIATTGDIVMSASGHDTMIGNGSTGTDVTGNVTGDISITAAGQTSFLNTSGGTNWIGNRTSSGSETGNVVLVTDSTDNEQGCSISCFATADLVGGDFTIGYTGQAAEGNNDGSGAYNSSHTLNILAAGNLAILNSVQNAGSGTINVVSGWDGHTLDPTQFGNAGVYGNNNAGFLVGGATANGGVAIGSAGGALNIYGNNVLANAVNGYAQMGFHGAGAGTILLHTLGTVTLDGGASSGLYAQIGNGGLGTVGSNSGSITVTAGGDLTLTAGTGDESYAQIGHGGAESNPNSSAYSNNAPITVTAADVILNGGSLEAYAQIGNGGFKAGEGLTGTALNGGDITVNSSHNVTLAAGSGSTAYAQIGNGGGQSNFNPGSSASGVDSGDIVVTAPNGTAGSVTLTAGTGANAYAQIGNGGYDANGTTATVSSVNFSMTGNVTVSDLALKGGDSNANAYAQIGQGDASLNSLGDVSGTIVTNTGGVPTTLTNGLAPHSPAEIGNFTGNGTSSGGSSGGGSGGGGSGGGSGGGGSGGDGGGGTPPPTGSVIDDPTTHGAIVDAVQPPPSKGTVITTIVLTDVGPADTGIVTVVEQLGPIAELTGAGGEPPTPADSATIVIAQSLDGAHKPPAGQPLIGNMLKRNDSSDDQHGTPPADQNISSWGNEALWQ